jgi:hypothetical protein
MAKKPRKKFETGEGNLDMIKNSVTAIKHHADELTAELKKNPEIEAWVLAKVDRAAQNLSDVTHYLDGEMNKFAKGGKTPVIRTQFEEEEFEYAKGGEFKPYGKTKGRFKIEYVEEGKKQSEIWLSKEMVEDRGKKLLKLGCTDIKITEVKKMAKGGETKPSLIPDYKKISNVEVEDIDRDDYPDFSDAYISYAEYDGEPMTDEQLEELNQDGLFVYDAIHSRLFADGGMMDEIQFDRDRNGSLYDRGRADSYYGRAREPHWYPNGTYNGEMVTELTKKEIEEYNKGYNENTDFKDYGEMAKGGKIKSRWIQDALSGDKGALRKTAKRKGLIKGDEKLSKSDLRKLEKMGGKTAKRARLAETLIDFKK